MEWSGYRCMLCAMLCMLPILPPVSSFRSSWSTVKGFCPTSPQTRIPRQTLCAHPPAAFSARGQWERHTLPASYVQTGRCTRALSQSAAGPLARWAALQASLDAHFCCPAVHGQGCGFWCVQNILISEDGRLKLADLGVAHVVQGRKGSTKVQVRMGAGRGGWRGRVLPSHLSSELGEVRFCAFLAAKWMAAHHPFVWPCMSRPWRAVVG